MYKKERKEVITMEDKNQNTPRDEVKVEGRLSNEHTHKDGTKGRDAYAAKVSYRNGVKVDERDAGWGHAHWQEDDKNDNKE